MFRNLVGLLIHVYLGPIATVPTELNPPNPRPNILDAKAKADREYANVG